MFVNCFMLVLFLLQSLFHRRLKVSGLLVAVCIPAFHNSDHLFSFPDYHLIICSGIRFFSFCCKVEGMQGQAMEIYLSECSSLFFHKLPLAT